MYNFQVRCIIMQKFLENLSQIIWRKVKDFYFNVVSTEVRYPVLAVHIKVFHSSSMKRKYEHNFCALKNKYLEVYDT